MSKYTQTKKNRLFEGVYYGADKRLHTVKRNPIIPPQERVWVKTYRGNMAIFKGQIICNGKDKEGKMTYITG